MAKKSKKELPVEHGVLDFASSRLSRFIGYECVDTTISQIGADFDHYSGLSIDGEKVFKPKIVQKILGQLRELDNLEYKEEPRTGNIHLIRSAGGVAYEDYRRKYYPNIFEMAQDEGTAPALRIQ